MSVGLLSAVVLLSSGCTFYLFSGGGPLTGDEIAGLRGILEPERELLKPADIREWAANLRTGTHDPAKGEYILKSDKDMGAIRLPFKLGDTFHAKGKHQTVGREMDESGWLYYVPRPSSSREFYAVKRVIPNNLSAMIAFYSSHSAHDVATGKRVKHMSGFMVLFGLLWFSECALDPVDDAGERGLAVVADGSVDLAEAQYKYRKGHSLLWGVVAWGRVNHNRYLQLLWIPIPLGRADSD